MTDDNDDLSPDIVAALRDVGPVDSSVREAHIARALDELDAGTTTGTAHRRLMFTRVAAAAVIALTVGVVVGRSTGDTNSTLRNTATATTVATTDVPPKASIDCAQEIGNQTFIGEWTDNGTEKFMTVDASNFYVRDAQTCAVLVTIARD